MSALKEPRRLEFHVVYRCVNRCVFCSEREHMAEFAAHPARDEEWRAILERKREQGFDHVTFTGGEPTLYPRIWEMLAHAKSLGYRTFMISNGTLLSLESFSRKILPLIDELCLSMHGFDGPTHDACTGRAGSFARLSAAFDNADRQDRLPFVFVNCVLTRVNVRWIEAILEAALRRKSVRHFLLSNLAPEGEGGRLYAKLSVKTEEFIGRLPAMSERARSRGVDLRVFGVPLCALGAWRELSNDLYYSPRVTVARAWLSDGRAGWFEEEALSPRRERVHVEACERCLDRDRCGGVFRRYVARYGAGNLSPRLSEIEAPR